MIDIVARRTLSLPHVGWLLDGPVERRQDGTLTALQASARYRCLSPARELTAVGGQVSIFGNVRRIDPAATAEALRRRSVDVVVAGKALGPAMLDVARLVRTQGTRLIADFCDDYFDHPEVGTLNRELASLADGIVASTPALAATVRHHIGRDATVISDPFEGPRGIARFAPRRDRLELLWFGNENNYSTIVPIVPQLIALSRQYPLRFNIVTALDHIGGPRNGLVAPGLLVNHVQWTTTERLWQCLAACDVVIIPSLPTQYHAVKSPNRLVESLWAGRAVAAHPVPSYGDFGAFCELAGDLAGAVAAMVADPSGVHRRIAEGQALIARRHAPAVIAAQWLDRLRDAASS
jgi:hypothetical protein